MKRAGCLLLAVASIVTVLVFVFDTGSASDGPQSREHTRQHARQSSGEDRTKDPDEDRGADKDGDRDGDADRDETAVAKAPPGLAAPEKKEIAQQIVASAENSTLDWRGQYGYIEDIGDGQGYTAGIIGFCTGTHDLLTLVERYTKSHPDNGLARYLPALREVDGSDSHNGLDPGFTRAWKKEANRPAFREAQDAERDRVYFDPAVRRGRLDGLSVLGQFIYYDAMVLLGPGTDGFYGLRSAAKAKALPPYEGGDERTYLIAFLDVSRAAMKESGSHHDTTRIDTAQRVFLDAGNFGLDTPLRWRVYGESFRIR